jgi:MOSC domain-containing protein YiiM
MAPTHNAVMTMIVRSVNVPRVDTRELSPVPGPVDIGLHGLMVDAAADDLTHALYAYPTTHHPFWRTVRAQAGVTASEEALPPAIFDEHLALEGIEESQLWVGDLLQFPQCTLAVSLPRLPDERFNQTLGFPHAARMVAQSRWCGFWLAVRVPGRIAVGDPFELIAGTRATGLVELFRARIKGKSW